MAETTRPVAIDRLVELAVARWRLATELAGRGTPSVNHALRKIDDFLSSCEIETRVLDGQPYEPGLAARVVDTVDDPTPDGPAPVIVETVCPMVLYQGNVVRGTDVVISKKPG